MPTKEFKRMKSKFDGFCTKCQKNFTEGTLINYYFDSKTTEHVKCKSPTGSPEPVALDSQKKAKSPIRVANTKKPVPGTSPFKAPEVSPFRQDQYELFRTQVLPEWAAIMAKHRIDITLWSGEDKAQVLKMFREYWDSTPPF